MKRLLSTKPLIAAAIALSAIGATSMAQADTHYDNHRSIAVGEPYGHQPIPAQYDNRGQFNRDRNSPMGDADHDGIPNRFDRDSRFFDRYATQRHALWGDFDRDGVPNKFDRAPNNPRRY